MRRRKKIFVSGCFDLLHSGHIRFLEKAAAYGDVYVAIGSDHTVADLKGRLPVTTEEERRYMLEAVRYVKQCVISQGGGLMDFVDEFKEIKPDIFVVNADGNTPPKMELCRKMGVEYVVLDRDPRHDLPARSTTTLRQECYIPYRLDLAGGWLDQPFVSKLYAGPVLTISLEPTLEFNERSGMASSTRLRAIELWRTDIPAGNREKLARLLFAYENPPGTTVFSGSQDSLGIVLPGLNRLDYRGGYWPDKISAVLDEEILAWIESCLHLVPLSPRKSTFDVLKGRAITAGRARALATAADHCWQAILSRDLMEFGRRFRESFEAQIALFPAMLSPEVRSAIRKYSKFALGWKLSGAGGGGYLVLVSARPVPQTIRLKIRRGSM
jgi:cytidyltransferase-like protein